MVRPGWIVIFCLTCGSLLAASPADRVKLNRAGLLALRDHALDDAETSFQRARKLAESLKQRDLVYAHSMNGLATVKQRKCEFDCAEELFRVALEVKALYLDPTDQDYVATHLNLGLVYQQQGRLLAARKVIQHILEMKVLDDKEESVAVAQARFSLGSIHLGLADLPSADRELNSSLQTLKKLQPKSPLLFSIRQALAQLSLDRGELQPALDELNELQHFASADQYALVEVDLALIQATQGRMKQSLSAADRADHSLSGWRQRVPPQPTVIHAERLIAMVRAANTVPLSAAQITTYRNEIKKFEAVADAHGAQQIANLKQVLEHAKQVKAHRDLADVPVPKDMPDHGQMVQFHLHQIEAYKYQIEFHKHQVEVQGHGKAALEALIKGDSKVAALQNMQAEVERLIGEIQLKSVEQHRLLAKQQTKDPLTAEEKSKLSDFDKDVESLNQKIEIQKLKLELRKLDVQINTKPTPQEQLRNQIKLACQTGNWMAPSNPEVRKQIEDSANFAMQRGYHALRNGQLVAAERAFAKAGLLHEKASGIHSREVVKCFRERSQVLLRLAEVQPNPAPQKWRSEVCSRIADELERSIKLQ